MNLTEKTIIELMERLNPNPFVMLAEKNGTSLEDSVLLFHTSLFDKYPELVEFKDTKGIKVSDFCPKDKYYILKRNVWKL